jgi:DNA-binding transcriptional regulator PaaX
MNEPNKTSLITNVLNYLGETSISLIVGGAQILLDPDKMIREYGITFSYSRKSYYNFKNSSCFKASKNKIYLTEKGRVKIIKNFIRNKNNNEKWNGKWMAIVFDIPEANKKERNFLRRELKWMKLKELQHSVWITPFDIEKELLVLLNLWHKDFRGDIRFLKIEKISEDTDLKNYFNI